MAPKHQGTTGFGMDLFPPLSIVLYLYSVFLYFFPFLPIDSMKNKGFHLPKTWFLGTKKKVFDG